MGTRLSGVIKRLTPRCAVPNYTPLTFSPPMGKQYNKTEKRRRRQTYLERRKQKAKTAGKGVSKPKAKRPAKKKAAEPAA